MDLYYEKHERADTYGLLARLFLGLPNEETFESLRLYYALDITDRFDAASEDFVRLLRELPPYESLNNFFPGERRRDVHDFYAKTGLVIDEQLGLPPDHLGVEMLFMSYLVEGDKMEEQRKFLEDHLLHWAPQYLERFAGAAKTKFYKDIAGITKNFLIADYDRLFE